jgi:hypothetical protein
LISSFTGHLHVKHNAPEEAARVVSNVSNVGNEHSIIVPIPTGLVLIAPRVRKIKFVGQNDNGSGHSAPDPILLVSKAAVVFSIRHGQRLAAGAEPHDDKWSDLDELAAEQYLEGYEALSMEPLMTRVYIWRPREAAAKIQALPNLLIGT